jgi:GTP cyclohydrolase-4
MKPLHTVYLGLGSNCGNRQANLLQALQHIRARAEIGPISSYYETEPVGCAGQPKFYNIACRIRTDLEPEALLALLKRIEKRMGRQQAERNAPRPIDIDILLYGDLVHDDETLAIPHPGLHKRAFALVPLSEIAPGAIHPRLGRTVESLLAKLSNWGVARLSLKPRLGLDVQQEKPAVPLSLSRVGVTNLRRNIQLLSNGEPVLFNADLDLFADLAPDHAGVHMSRFGDAVESLLQKMTLEPMPDIESLAGRLSRRVAAGQGALRSEIHIRARSPLLKTTPVSGKTSEDVYTLIGIASTTADRTRCLVGVETEGMTVCPCAQDMVKGYSRDLLLEEGFSPEQVERILAAIPIASHNQRGRGTLLVGSDIQVRAENLVHLVETAMSSETYAILKRPDELFVVNKAHRQPRFVEDVVREMLYSLVDTFPELPDDAFVLAKQKNLESIHKHNAFAERYGTLGEIRRELRGEGSMSGTHTSLDQWLKG